MKYRTGILTSIKDSAIYGDSQVFETCIKHGKRWHEGASFKDGACEECINNARPTKYKRKV